mmetsp:Transcript_711/g.2305  ORF Transcript_711/g.2305 Transcript_711/m.2305 type:complete len:112 (-) Transcript_711:24-359(-)
MAHPSQTVAVSPTPRHHRVSPCCITKTVKPKRQAMSTAELLAGLPCRDKFRLGLTNGNPTAPRYVSALHNARTHRCAWPRCLASLPSLSALMSLSRPSTTLLCPPCNKRES